MLRPIAGALALLALAFGATRADATAVTGTYALEITRFTYGTGTPLATPIRFAAQLTLEQAVPSAGTLTDYTLTIAGTPATVLRAGYDYHRILVGEELTLYFRLPDSDSLYLYFQFNGDPTDIRRAAATFYPHGSGGPDAWNGTVQNASFAAAPAAVPEPMSLALFGGALAGLGVLRGAVRGAA